MSAILYYERLEEENARLTAELQQARDEIKVSDKLINERNRILERLPCPDHGHCVPHVLDEIERLTVQVRTLAERLKKLLNACDDTDWDYEWSRGGNDKLLAECYAALDTVKEKT